ncbi:hypothetical protein Tco_0610627 [Tanacetum coccineum]
MKKLDEPEDSKDSTAVNAFEENLFYIKPYNGRRRKPKNQVAGKERSRMAVSSSSQEPSRSSKSCLVDSEKQMTSKHTLIKSSSWWTHFRPQPPPKPTVDFTHRMEIDGTKRKGPTPLTLDWDKINLTEDGDDRPPELIITKSNKKPKESFENSYQAEDTEVMRKSDRELSGTIARMKNTLKICGKLSDGGEKLRANLKRHEDELERRRDLQLANKVDNECKEMIQVSDSDDISVSRGKKQGDRKSLSSPNFTKLFNKKLDNPEAAKDSRTVNALDEDLFYMKPCNGRRGKPKNQVAAKGRSRMAVSCSSQEPSRSSKSCLVDSEKQMTSNDDKSTSSFSVPNSPQGPPSSNLRPRTVDNECEEKIQVSDDDAAEHTSVYNHHRMVIDGCKRKGPTLLTLDRNKLLPLSTDRPPQIIMTSNKKPKKSPENSYQTEDLELVVKSDRELNETIAKLRANLKRHQDELQRRQLNAVWFAEADNLSILAAAAAENC